MHHRHPDGERDLHTPRKGIWHWGSMAVLALVLPLAWFCTLVVLPILLSVHQENIINVCCHIRALGYRNHDTRDDSVNIWPLGILFWGQGSTTTITRAPIAATSASDGSSSTRAGW